MWVVEHTTRLLMLLGWPPPRPGHRSSTSAPGWPTSATVTAAYETLRRDKALRAQLDLPHETWIGLLRITLGHPTATGMLRHGVLARLLVGDTLPDLLADDDLVATAAERATPSERVSSMGSRDGHIELDRPIDTIRVGRRHRQDLGDLEELTSSIRDQGLLQPITISPDGTLICGARRLEVARRLGWHKINVWVRAGISTPLERLLAEQHENTTRKPYTPTEAAAMYRELKTLIAEDAARHQQASRFGADQTADDADGEVGARCCRIGSTVGPHRQSTGRTAGDRPQGLHAPGTGQRARTPRVRPDRAGGPA